MAGAARSSLQGSGNIIEGGRAEETVKEPRLGVAPEMTHEFSEAMVLCTRDTRLGPSTLLMDGGGTGEAPLLPQRL